MVCAQNRMSNIDNNR